MGGILPPPMAAPFDLLVIGAGSGGLAAAKRAAAQKKNPNAAGPRQQFLALFEGDPDADATEYLAGIPQVLSLMNSPRMNAPSAAVRLTQGLGNAEAVDKLYLATLSHRPTGEEREKALKVVRQSDTPRQALGDVLWALMNSTAFASNY